MDRIKPRPKQQTNVGPKHTWWKLQFHGNVSRTRSAKSHDHRENNKNSKRNRYHKYLYPVIALAFAAPVNAETVGGVSATANPVANSSGSVTNQAIQVLQGPYIQNGYGDGIVCQGPTANFTPYVTRSTSWNFPYEPTYQDPVYNMLDLVGDFDDNGNAIPDGIPDHPGQILYHREIRTGQKDNYNWNAGFSATISWPLDGEAQELCKEAARNHNMLREQMTANRRLEFELTRLSRCGELAQNGITFATWSPYFDLCKDVVVNPKMIQGVPHTHSINPVSSSKVVTPSSNGNGQSSSLKEISVGDVTP